MRKFSERFMKFIFIISACASIVAVALICIFLFSNGIKTMFKIDVWDFLSGTDWTPSRDIYGILPMIVGSIYVTAGAIIMGVPIGLLCAVFMAKFCPEWLYRFLKPATNLMAGIPSIVYGFFGLVVIVRLMQNTIPRQNVYWQCILNWRRTLRKQ